MNRIDDELRTAVRASPGSKASVKRVPRDAAEVEVRYQLRQSTGSVWVLGDVDEQVDENLQEMSGSAR